MGLEAWNSKWSAIMKHLVGKTNKVSIMKHLVGKTNKVSKQAHYKQQEPHDIGNKL